MQRNLLSASGRKSGRNSVSIWPPDISYKATTMANKLPIVQPLGVGIMTQVGRRLTDS